MVLKVELNEMVGSWNSFHAAPVTLGRTTLAFLNLYAAAFPAAVQTCCYFSVHTLFMKEAKGTALDVCLFWLSLIEVSSLMTPHKTDHPYSIDNVWALWKLYLNI